MVVGPMRARLGDDARTRIEGCGSALGECRGWRVETFDTPALVSPRARDKVGLSRSAHIGIEASAKDERVVVPEAVWTLLGFQPKVFLGPVLYIPRRESV